jgi:hypothetical protein
MIGVRARTGIKTARTIRGAITGVTKAGGRISLKPETSKEAEVGQMAGSSNPSKQEANAEMFPRLRPIPLSRKAQNLFKRKEYCQKFSAYSKRKTNTVF